MAIKDLIARGIGFAPGSTRYIPTLGMGFSSGSASTVVQYLLEADFDRDGIYEANLADYGNILGGGFRMARGLDRNGSYEMSALDVGLDNNDGAFTPEYASGAFFGQLGPHTPFRIRAAHNSIFYVLWTGYVQRWMCDFRGVGNHVARLHAEDIFAYLKDSDPVNVLVSTSRDTDGALVAVMDELSLTVADRDFEDGLQDLPMHYAVGQTALAAMLDIVASEMGGLLWVNADGQLRFEARNTRLGVTPTDTWGDGTDIQPEHVSYELDPWDIVTGVRARATVFRTGQADVEVFRFSRGMGTKPTADSLALTAGEVYEREFNTQSALAAMTSPAATTDYLANDAADGSGTDRTGSLTVTVTDHGGGRFRLKLKNTYSGTVYVTKFRLRGQPVNFFADRPEVYFTKNVSGMKAGRTVDIDVPFSGDGGQTIRDYAYSLLRTYRYAYPRLTLDFAWDSAAITVAMLAVELGRRVKFADKAPGTGGQWVTNVDDWWYVERIEQTARPGDVSRTIVTLIPSYLYRNLDRIAFDVFDRTNATGDLGTSTSGDTWADDGNMDITSAKARASSDSLQMPNLDLGSGATDQVIEVSLAAIGTGDESGLVFRYEDANNQYRAYIDKGSNEVILEKNVAAVVTELASPAYTVGTAGELRVIVQGSRIRVWVDGRLYIDEDDGSLTAGTKLGIFARNASGTATFADFYGQGL